MFLALKRPLYRCTLWYVALATGRGMDFTIPVPDPGILSPFQSLCPPLPRFLTGYFFTLHPRLKRVTGIRTEKRTLHCSTKDQMPKTGNASQNALFPKDLVEIDQMLNLKMRRK